MLTRRPACTDRLDPLFRRPSPEGTVAFCHLSKEKEQDVPAQLCFDAGVVEDIVQRTDQAIERRTKVHRATIAIKSVRLRIACQHVLLDSCKRGRSVVLVRVERPDPWTVIGLLW